MPFQNGLHIMSRVQKSLLLAIMFTMACTQQNPSPDIPDSTSTLQAESWHAADRLFFDNPDSPQWKGADVANSVALGGNRILWVFGDTLLTEPGVNSCDRFDQFHIRVHNSLALQLGTDPTTASIRHYWGQQNGEPTSFFSPRHGHDSWYWMGGATVIEGQALVFLMHARSATTDAMDEAASTACAGLNFEMLGWDARIAKITSKGPDQWQWREVSLPDDVNWHNILVGTSSINVDEDYLYAWSAGPASQLTGNPVYLARWPLAAAAQAELSRPQWYTDAGWKMQSVLGEDKPTAIVVDGNK